MALRARVPANSLASAVLLSLCSALLRLRETSAPPSTALLLLQGLPLLRPSPFQLVAQFIIFYRHTSTYSCPFSVSSISAPRLPSPKGQAPAFVTTERTPRNWPRAWHTISLHQSVLNEQINHILTAWLYVRFCPESRPPQSRYQLWFISGSRNRLGVGGDEDVGPWRWV